MREENMPVGRLLKAERRLRARLLEELSEAELRRFDTDWPSWVHEGQSPPEGDCWRIWLNMSGRGYGKTRAGAEWISQLAREQPGAWFALVGATLDEARRVMVEGRSGLLAVARPGKERAEMVWEPSRRRLQFASGATAFLFSGARADALRGAEHHFAWCDELAKWKQAQGAWDNLMFGLRMGDNPRALVTTTPRPIALLKAIIGGDGTMRTGGASEANPHVSAPWLAAMERQHEGTRLGRQELDGELIEDLEGALWTRGLIEECRIPSVIARSEATKQSSTADAEAGLLRSARNDEVGLWRRVVVGVDPPASVAGTCGIVVCGTDEKGMGYVLADLSVGGLSPEGWARKVAGAAEAWRAHRVVAEANNGGKMVETVLRGAAVNLPVKLVHAADGKAARAAPVSTLFESGRAKLAGRFPALEDELCGLTWGGDYQGPGRSPDRADDEQVAMSPGHGCAARGAAHLLMVWALTELMLGPQALEPRVRGF